MDPRPCAVPGDHNKGNNNNNNNALHCLSCTVAGHIRRVKIQGCVPFPGDHNKGCIHCTVCLAQLRVTREG